VPTRRGRSSASTRREGPQAPRKCTAPSRGTHRRENFAARLQHLLDAHAKRWLRPVCFAVLSRVVRAVRHRSVASATFVPGRSAILGDATARRWIGTSWLRLHSMSGSFWPATSVKPKVIELAGVVANAWSVAMKSTLTSLDPEDRAAGSRALSNGAPIERCGTNSARVPMR